jgi:hypothetical protein
MPTIDKARMRERMRNLKRGDYLALAASPAPSMMVVDGKPVTMQPPTAEAELEAEKKREDDRWWLKSLGPW